MNEAKERNREAYRQLTPETKTRLRSMLEQLQQLPGTEASLSATEMRFYELLNSMKAYTDAEGVNPFITALEDIRRSEYEKCKDRFVSLSVRNNAVRLFKNKLQHVIAGWLD
jgi:hypothetical protein